MGFEVRLESREVGPARRGASQLCVVGQGPDCRVVFEETQNHLEFQVPCDRSGEIVEERLCSREEGESGDGILAMVWLRSEQLDQRVRDGARHGGGLGGLGRYGYLCDGLYRLCDLWRGLSNRRRLRCGG